MKNDVVFVVYDELGEEVRAVFSIRSLAEVYVESARDSEDLVVLRFVVDSEVVL